jgi:peptidoglycan hydrolase-like protein with peptidoglycan-binding domain
MFSKQIITGVLSAALLIAPVARVAADSGDLVGGIVGGIIGGVIVNEGAKNRERKESRTVTRTIVVAPSVSRAENREVQTALNYFGFPAGAADGILGRRSRGAISQYQQSMGYIVTGLLTPYERDFLVTSYYRAVSGGAATSQRIAADPMGARGLLLAYQQETVNPGDGTAGVAPFVDEVVATAPALPNFMGAAVVPSLASHCNAVSLMTNSNGGFATASTMVDANAALNEQFCLARTYAIARGEDLASRVQGFTPRQIAEQCEAFGPAMREHIAALSVKSVSDVVSGVSGFVLASGVSPAQMSGTARICLSVGYRTDNMNVAIGSALMLYALGEKPYGELLGHHLLQGFGASRRSDLAFNWYSAALDAQAAGAPAVFAPGQPERNNLIRQASLRIGGGTSASPTGTDAPVATSLPSFMVAQ